jgi:hypothetical protein
MKNRATKNKLILFLTVMVLSGCMTTKETKLVNASGEAKYCYLASDTTLLSVQAHGEYAKCLNDAGMAGYRKTQ